MTLAPEELAEIERLEQAATPAPWETYSRPGSQEVLLCSHGHVVAHLGDEVEPSDAAFIVAARNALPSLIHEICRLRASIGEST